MKNKSIAALIIIGLAMMAAGLWFVKTSDVSEGIMSEPPDVV